MAKQSEQRRVLLAAGARCATDLVPMFEHPALKSWDVIAADTLAQSRFQLQHGHCHLLVVSADLTEGEGTQGLNWLVQHGNLPIVFLAGNDPQAVMNAYKSGIDVCLPQALAIGSPELMSAALNRALAAGKARRQQQRTARRLAESRRQQDRLVNLIWRTMPAKTERHWLPQRFALQRLHEELARTKRHGVPLTVAIGEVAAGDRSRFDQIGDWIPDFLAQVKRRSDVVGQYGINGFLLLMVHTGKEGGVACCRRLTGLFETAAKDNRPNGATHLCFGLTSTIDHQATAPCLLRWAEKNLELARTGKHDRIVAI